LVGILAAYARGDIAVKHGMDEPPTGGEDHATTSWDTNVPSVAGFDEAVSRFGAAVKAKLSNPALAGSPEDQLRAPLEGLIADLAAIVSPVGPAVVLVGEAGIGALKVRPDYAVTRQDVLIGFIEVKAAGKGADPRRFADKHDREQWDRRVASGGCLCGAARHHRADCRPRPR
jgi:hypothetical protein